MSARASSSYYPPRAGRGRHFNHLGYTVRSRLHLEQLGLKLKTSPSRFAIGLVVPGFGFLEAGWKTLGKATLLAWVVAALVFVVWLGYGISTLAFGLMMSMHVSSILYLHNRNFPGMRVLRRLLFSLAILFVVGQLVYASGLKLCHNYLFMPLRVGEKVYVVNRLRDVQSLRRGDFVACHAEAAGVGNVRIRDGYILDKIIAAPRDRVEFSQNGFSVNGVQSRSLRFMPLSGTTVLPPRTWLIWPSLETVVSVNVDPQSVSVAVLQMAMVRRDQMIGKPFKWWFWRRQLP
jgi:hypothetical protein